MKTNRNPRILHVDICLDDVRDEEYIQIRLVPEKGQDESRMLLLDWVEQKQEEYRKKAEAQGRRPGTAYGAGTLKTHLRTFLNGRYPDPVYLDQVDKDFCTAFARYLQSARNLRVGNAVKPLAGSTRKRLFAQFRALVSKAVQSGKLPENPIDRMDRSDKPKAVPPARTYLTPEEIRTLRACPSGPERVRNAFLFSCFCGLRWSDVKSLTWEDIRSEENHLVIAKQMEKTREWVVIPLNKEAASFLPPKKGTFVFDLPSSTAANADLKRWARAAGIRKKVTFHTARHTFATLLLTLGADLYTTSKLLGHTNITTTQIYAEVVDEKKSRAVRLMDGLL